MFLKCNSIRPAKKNLKKVEWKEKTHSIKSHQDFMGKEVKTAYFSCEEWNRKLDFFYSPWREHRFLWLRII